MTAAARDAKRLKEDMDQALQKTIAKASEEAFAFIESRPATTFLFSVHKINPAFAPVGVRYSPENPEAGELCDVLRKTFPRMRGVDIHFTQAFNSIVAKAREQDYLLDEPGQPDSVIAIRVRGPIAVRKPLTFKKGA
jgi:hypothetical protein